MDSVIPKWHVLWNTPECQCRIFRDGGKSVMEDVEVESNKALKRSSEEQEFKMLQDIRRAQKKRLRCGEALLEGEVIL